MYQGKLKFPSEFPFKPPSIYMITPNGTAARARAGRGSKGGRSRSQTRAFLGHGGATLRPVQDRHAAVPVHERLSSYDASALARAAFFADASLTY